ncbi:polyprenyl synthetase family protein [Streptomyces sp. NPDC093589]|uniref:polyprenyl synthetase family protein n=1 Tax=Streptomyces sp. NPDC093589 TaxID=3366043 RepID=UPI003823461A
MRRTHTEKSRQESAKPPGESFSEARKGSDATALPGLAAIRTSTNQSITQLLDREAPRLNALGLTEHQDALRSLLLSAGGKRMRALSCLWGWRGAGGTGSQGEVHTAAAALELNHSAFLIHDDIIDRSELRRGQPTLHRRFATHHAGRAWHGDSHVFGDAVALPLGDLCMAWAGELIGGCADGDRLRTVMTLYHRMCAEAGYGETLEAQIQADRDYQVDRCMAVATCKAARYMITPPLLIGAALAGGDEAVRLAYERFGTALGEAYQLRDDLLGVFGDPDITGKPNVDDLRDGKPTVLFATALRTASPAQRGTLLALYGRPDLDEDTADEIRDLLRHTHAATRVEEMIRARSREAARALESAPITGEAKAALQALAAHALFRAR